MVIGGRSFAVGSQRRSGLSRIRSAAGEENNQLTISAYSTAAGGMDIQIAGPVKAQASVWIVTFLNSAETRGVEK